MKVVIAPDSFTRFRSAERVARILAASLREDPLFEAADIRLLPMADGGTGTLDVLAETVDGQWVCLPVPDALGRSRSTSYFLSQAGETAVIEMARASGIEGLVRPDARRASTYGTGCLVADAVERGVNRILVGLGGSATTDLGLGVASALGWRFLDAAGAPVDFSEPGLDVLRSMERIRRIDGEAAILSEDVEMVALADVNTPVCGPRGSVALFGEQKGISVTLAPRFEAAMEHVVSVVATDLGESVGEWATASGAGAAGGLGFGLAAFAGATLVPGASLISEVVGLADACRDADLVITGEGRFDEQSSHSKVVSVVAQVARGVGAQRVAVVAGSVADSAEAEMFDWVIDASEGQPVDLEREGEGRLKAAVGRLVVALREV